MKDFISFLKDRKIEEAFLGLCLNFNELFPWQDREKATWKYGNHEWLVKTVPKFNTIINAVPPDEKIGEHPWEEWYVLDEKIHHHVLYLEEPARYDEIYDAPDFDDIHPPRTLGKKWFVIEDPDMSPVLLR